jgi:hypothetical protein
MFAEYVVPYNRETYDFQSIVRRIFGIEDLQQTHLLRPPVNEQITFDEDTKTWFHRTYYSSPHYPELIALYERFVRDVLLRHPEMLPPNCSDTEYALQVDPSFRIHLPNNTALGRRDDDAGEAIGMHCDADYNHQPGEINFILPLTPMFETNSVYVESEPGQGDFHPAEVAIGELFCFYGNKCRHYNRRNDTGVSRLSLDFRIIPMKTYDSEWPAVSIHGKRPLTLGGYFKKIHGAAGRHELHDVGIRG